MLDLGVYLQLPSTLRRLTILFWRDAFVSRVTAINILVYLRTNMYLGRSWDILLY